MDDLEAVFDREAAVRTEIEDAFLGLEPPEEIAGVFAETPCMPSDLKDTADAVIGCDTIPDSLDAAFSR